MRSSIILLTVSLVTLALGAPTEILSRPLKKRSFKVERVPNPNFSGHGGAAALKKAYVKWGMRPTTDEIESDPNNLKVAYSSDAASGPSGSSGSTSGSVQARPLGDDIEFISPVQIGGQTLNLDFDTGSSDLWVFSTNLSSAARANHNVYDPTKSTTFKPIRGATFSISYGDSSAAAGVVGTETVDVGGATFPSQAVELATELSDSFVTTMGSDGLVGLAFSKLNTVKPARQKTFFDNVQATLLEPVFTASLKHGTTGSYDFGVIDSTKFNGPLSWASVNSANGFWEVTSEQFSINNGAPIATAGCNAIIDTGTTLMIVNPVIINAYYSQVAGARNSAKDGGIEFPCTSTLPDLQIDIGGSYMANIPGSLIKVAPTDDSGSLCYGGLQPATSNLQILGDIFLKAQFVAFNGGNTSVGLAPHS